MPRVRGVRLQPGRSRPAQRTVRRLPLRPLLFRRRRLGATRGRTPPTPTSSATEACTMGRPRVPLPRPAPTSGGTTRRSRFARRGERSAMPVARLARPVVRLARHGERLARSVVRFTRPVVRRRRLLVRRTRPRVHRTRHLARGTRRRVHGTRHGVHGTRGLVHGLRRRAPRTRPRAKSTSGQASGAGLRVAPSTRAVGRGLHPARSSGLTAAPRAGGAWPRLDRGAARRLRPEGARRSPRRPPAAAPRGPRWRTPRPWRSARGARPPSLALPSATLSTTGAERPPGAARRDRGRICRMRATTGRSNLDGLDGSVENLEGAVRRRGSFASGRQERPTHSENSPPPSQSRDRRRRRNFGVGIGIGIGVRVGVGVGVGPGRGRGRGPTPGPTPDFDLGVDTVGVRVAIRPGV